MPSFVSYMNSKYPCKTLTNIQYQGSVNCNFSIVVKFLCFQTAGSSTDTRQSGIFLHGKLFVFFYSLVTPKTAQVRILLIFLDCCGAIV